MILKIATFNIRLNTSSDNENAWPYRKYSVIKFFNEYQPLIFGTQEVLDDQLTDLVNGLPNYHYIGINRRQHEEGNYIFYNKDLIECKEACTFWLSETPYIPNSVSYNSCCIRICTFGEFILRDNRNIRFRLFNTHLDHISTEAQVEGIKLVIKKMNEKNCVDPLPSIIIGDFNVNDDNEVIKLLNEAGLVNTYKYINPDNYGRTFHGYRGITEGSPIDYIFVSPDITIEDILIYREKVDERFISDHYPVLATVKLSQR